MAAPHHDAAQPLDPSAEALREYLFLHPSGMCVVTVHQRLSVGRAP